MRLFLAVVALALAAYGRPLLVISVDGLDHRYLRDADKLGLKIPNLRRLIREGSVADGVIGVAPTITWPSHTTLISGVIPSRHGILGNRRPKSEGGDYYWTADLLKAPTLLDAARSRGLKTAAITWPVTVDAPVDYNLPELFSRRNGGAMDLLSIGKKATPGLIDEISAMYPSFPKIWMDDRARAQATMYLLQRNKPDLLLVHFVDHDAEAHETGPFTREAKALVEYSDELIGKILRVLPKEYAVAIVSDHGFERVDRMVDLAKEAGEDVVVTPWIALAKTDAAVRRLREIKARPDSGIGREISGDEISSRGPQYPKSVAGFEPAPHVMFGSGEVHERGNHGFWPTREDYRASFILFVPGEAKRSMGRVEMTSIAGEFARILGLGAFPK